MFFNADNTCSDAPKIEKSFLFFKWSVKRNCFYSPVHVGNWGNDLYEVTGKCKYCGNRRRVFGIELRQLKKFGLRPPNLSERFFGYSIEEEPK